MTVVYELHGKILSQLYLIQLQLHYTFLVCIFCLLYNNRQQILNANLIQASIAG